MIVIVARNNLRLTQAAVRSAQVQVPAVDTLVVDNASTDGTGKWLATAPVATMCFQTQVSLAAVWNAALRWTMLTRGLDRVLVCNNDIVLRPDTFGMLAALREDFVTCVSVDSAAQLGVRGDRSLEDLRASVRLHPDFSCFMIRKTVVERTGWFDESYFPAWFEDNNYHARMWECGVRAICVDLPFLHLGSQTLSAADPAEKNKLHHGYDRNKMKFLKDWGCLPGTPAYDELFSPARFGVGQAMTRNT